MNKHSITTSVVILAFTLTIFSCKLRRSEPLKGTFVPRNSMVERGQALFNLHCQKCHPAGEAGLGPGINWNPAPSFIKRF